MSPPSECSIGSTLTPASPLCLTGTRQSCLVWPRTRRNPPQASCCCRQSPHCRLRAFFLEEDRAFTVSADAWRVAFDGTYESLGTGTMVECLARSAERRVG